MHVQELSLSVQKSTNAAANHKEFPHCSSLSPLQVQPSLFIFYCFYSWFPVLRYKHPSDILMISYRYPKRSGKRGHTEMRRSSLLIMLCDTENKALGRKGVSCAAQVTLLSLACQHQAKALRWRLVHFAEETIRKADRRSWGNSSQSLRVLCPQERCTERSGSGVQFKEPEFWQPNKIHKQKGITK